MVVFKNCGCPDIRSEVYSRQVQSYTDCRDEEHLASRYPLSPTNLLSSSKVNSCSIAGRRSLRFFGTGKAMGGWSVTVTGGGDARCPWTCTAAQVCCVKPCKLVLCRSYLSHPVRYMHACMGRHLAEWKRCFPIDTVAVQESHTSLS